MTARITWPVVRDVSASPRRSKEISAVCQLLNGMEET